MLRPSGLFTMRAPDKTSFSGLVLAIQPRIQLTRSFDQRSHNYQGFTLRVGTEVGGEPREIMVGIGEAAQAKHMFRVGDQVSGEGVPVARVPTELVGRINRLKDRIPTEPVDLYRVSRLKLLDRKPDTNREPPPWHGVPPPLPTYRQRGHRRLDARTYEGNCTTCIWGCRMPVEMIIDQWKPSLRRYREETFCYGPLSCRLYKAGPTRKVPGRRGMSWEEEDWVDEEVVRHRGPDE